MPAVVTYKAPNTASPSLGTFNIVVAQVVFTDLDTSAAIVHNFGLSGLSPSGDNGSGFPLVIVNYLTPPTTSIASLMTVALTDSSTVTVSKTAAVGSLCTVLVQIARPHTFIR